MTATIVLDEFTTVLQPIRDLVSGRTVGFEALTRTRRDSGSAVEEWLAAARDLNLHAELEIRLARAALRTLYVIPTGAFLSLNVSPDVLVDPRFTHMVGGTRLDRVVLEITENQRVTDYGTLAARVGWLRSRGARIAVDDVGSGYSTLGHVVQVHPEMIKLDAGLTRGVDVDDTRRLLVEALSSFARATRAILVAEGVESDKELDALRRAGVHYGQGYHLGRPRPVGEMAAVRIP